MPDYEPVIGLEVHAEMLTESKMFCACAVVDSTAADPNTQICPVCSAQPGVLPVINQRAVEYAIRVGLALNCRINSFSQFARKSYFYPDLPKGYQISQYEHPLASEGWLDLMVNGELKRIGVTRAHLEEDTGKSFHKGGYSLVDLNRAGVPLLEIVSEPDFRDVETVETYARQLRAILQALDVNHGDMSKGVLRFEANISVRPVGSDAMNTRTEVKNLNSIRSLVRACRYEIKRQSALYEAGKPVVQQTMGFNENTGETFTQRLKEAPDDYRYFPEPDLPPLILSESWIEEIRASLPELPAAMTSRFIANYGLSAEDAAILAGDQAIAAYFEATLAAGIEAQTAANWITIELFRVMNDTGAEIEALKVRPEQLANLLRLVEAGTINKNTAKEVLAQMLESGQDLAAIIEAQGLAQISDRDALEALVDAVLAAHPDQVRVYLDGKEGLMGFFVGQVMRETQGQANAGMLNELFRAKFEEMR